MTVPGTVGSDEASDGMVVVLPADEHDAGVAAHHVGGELGFLALGVEEETIAIPRRSLRPWIVWYVRCEAVLPWLP